MTLRPTEAVRSSGPDAVELAAACGLVPDDWQAEELFWALGETADGLWAATDINLICPRQNGKNVIVEIRELYGLVVLGERILHTAHLFPTAKESFTALEGMVRSNPHILAELVDLHASPASGYDMEFRSGGRIQYIARSRTSGRGFRAIDLLVMDEAQDFGDDAQGALLPTTSSKPNAQKWYQGSAPGLGSTVLHRIRANGRAGRPGPVSYAEYSADPESSLDDRAAWARANPAFPHRISEQTIEAERLAMSDELFARERLSISPDLLESGGPFGSAWAEVQHDDLEVVPLLFAVDVNPERTAAGIVAVGEQDGVPTVEVVEYRPGTDWVVDRCKYLRTKYKVRFAVDKTGPAGTFIDDLRRAGCRRIELDGSQMCYAAETFFDQVAHRNVRVRPNDDLDRAVSGAVQAPVGDAWKWGRKRSLVDISLLVAASAGVFALGQRKSARLVSMVDLLAQIDQESGSVDDPETPQG